MHQVVRIAFAALVAGVFLNIAGFAAAPPGLPPAVKQIQLTDKHIESFIAAQKDMGPILEKIQGAASDQLPANIQADLEAAAKKNGFKDFAEYDEVVGNITMVMAGIDPKTKAFTEPADAIKKEIADVTADKSIPAADKKQLLDELNEALKSVQPIQFPGNIELVKKYYDKIDAALT
jgi:phage-related tail protein